ncbi:unnamed protein product [Macrosiphum euphorbiae]|uniref:Secreted protein n=1 Tax=Macrosiphum euphorbiae TaxID=13131 RepID=A0AAV0W9M4_9HEMI|nr:unnamed protein product [Macrosiphum euphorbiae]
MWKILFFLAYPCQQVFAKRHVRDEVENKNSDRNPFEIRRPPHIVRVCRPVYPIGGDSPPLFRLPSSGVRSATIAVGIWTIAAPVVNYSSQCCLYPKTI